MPDKEQQIGFSYNVTSRDAMLRAVVKNGVELDRLIEKTLNKHPLAEIDVRIVYGPKEQLE